MKPNLSALFSPALFLPFLCVCAAPAWANAAAASVNDKPQYAYQDGVLQGFERRPSEDPCAGSSDASVSSGDSRETFASISPGASSCANDFIVVYRVRSGGATYILTPKGDMDNSQGGLLRRALIPHSVLDHQPPQTAIKIRSDGRHFFVKIGDRESVYSVTREE